MVCQIPVQNTISQSDECMHFHCVQRAPVCEVSSRPYLFAYCLNIYHTLFYTYLNNRRTGKDATKPRTLGLLGHSNFIYNDMLYIKWARTVLFINTCDAKLVVDCWYTLNGNNIAHTLRIMYHRCFRSKLKTLYKKDYP